MNQINYLERKTKVLNWELHIYVQGNELVDKRLQDTPRIKYHIGNLSYKDVINKYLESDITIHLGDHEGLGLGFYESLNCYTPILTLNCYPNCEIIKNNRNGWLIDCQFENFTWTGNEVELAVHRQTRHERLEWNYSTVRRHSS